MANKRDFRTTWRYRKKPPKYRKPLIMEVKQTIPTVGEVTSTGIRYVSLLPGRYEIQITQHPDPEKRGPHSRWVTIVSNDRVLGMAKRYAKTLQKDGLVRIFIPES